MKLQNAGPLPAVAIKRTGTMVLLSSHSPVLRRDHAMGAAPGDPRRSIDSDSWKPGAPGHLYEESDLRCLLGQRPGNL